MRVLFKFFSLGIELSLLISWDQNNEDIKDSAINATHMRRMIKYGQVLISRQVETPLASALKVVNERSNPFMKLCFRFKGAAEVTAMAYDGYDTMWRIRTICGQKVILHLLFGSHVSATMRQVAFAANS